MLTMRPLPFLKESDQFFTDNDKSKMLTNPDVFVADSCSILTAEVTPLLSEVVSSPPVLQYVTLYGQVVRKTAGSGVVKMTAGAVRVFKLMLEIIRFIHLLEDFLLLMAFL